MCALKFFMLAFTSFHLSDSDLGSKIIGVIVLSLYIALTLLIVQKLRQKEKILESAESKEKFGELYGGLTTLNSINILSEKPLTWLYMPLFLFRRFLFAIITVYLIETPNMQLILHQIISMVYITRFLAVGRLYADLN